MLFGTTAPLDALILWCRAIRHGLDVGLSPVKVFRQQAKSGPSALRDVADRAADRLAQGESLEAALKPDAKKFPPLFLEMVSVGEHAGRLPDIFAELEEHFETLKIARRAFLRVLAWPAFTYVSAIVIIFLMLFVLGMFGSGLDPLGLGLTGVKGAFAFLALATMFTVGLVCIVLFVANNLQFRAALESFALRIPGLGGCFRAFALSRFCTAYHMTAEAGMRADRCLRFSLRATANKAYTKEAEYAAKLARSGQDVPEILGACGPRLFPDEFMAVIHVGEDTGRMAEVMKKQADYYREESRRKLKLLAMITSGLVYGGIMLLMAVLIVNMVYTVYIKPINNAVKWADDPNSFMRADP
jgi:type IV pilus assembly protein PilC